MNNYFEFRNQFVLIDIDGIFLDAANDQLEIREPINIAETSITLERSDFHGVDFEFSDPDTPFGFTRHKVAGETRSAFNMIRAISRLRGVDGKCIFQIQSQRKTTRTEVTRNTGDPNNIQSISGIISLLGVYDIRVGDSILITTETPSVYDNQTYTITVVFNDLVPGRTIFQVAEAVVDSAYQGNWTITNTPAVDIDYRGDLDFNTYDQLENQINITSRRINLDDKFRTRRDTPVSVTATETIDGTTITPPTPRLMFLHSKVIQTSQKGGSLEDVGIGQTAVEFFGSGIEYTLQLDYSSPTSGGVDVINFNNNIETKFGTGVFTDMTEIASDNLMPHYIFRNLFGSLDVDYQANYYVLFNNFNTLTIQYLGTFISVNGVETQINPAFDYVADSATYVATVNFSYQGTFDIPRSGEVKIFDRWNLPINTNIIQSRSITPNAGHSLSLDFNGSADNSLATVYSASSVFQHVINSITDEGSSFLSDFFTNSGSNFYLTNGYALRGFSQTFEPLRMSFESLFDNWASPTFGLGFAVVDDGDFQKIRIERFTDFYNDTEIDYITSVQDDSTSISFDQDFVFNTAEVGYKTFPNSNDENKDNNIDEFNTMHNLLFPIERVKRKLSLESEVIASGYKIENQRREQFSEVEQETVTDDENTFVIKGIENEDYLLPASPGQDVQTVIIDSVGTIAILGTYYDINTGDLVTMTRDDAFVLISNESVINVTRSGLYTTITVGASLSDGVSTASDWTIAVGNGRIRASRNEEFEVLDNVIDPPTVYNAGLNPKYMLLNHGPIINSGFNFKNDSDLVRTQNVRLNENMRSQFKVNQGAYTLASIEQLVVMGDNLTLNEVNGFNRLFSGRIITFTTSISFSRVLNIVEAYQDIRHDNYYGYIRVANIDGEEIRGYLISMSYKLFSNQAIFTLREKSDFEIVLVEYSYSLVTGFASSELACDSTGSPSVIYANTSSLVVGSLLYTTSGDNTTIVSDGWLFDSANDRSIQTANGLIVNIVNCPQDPPPDPDKFANFAFINDVGFDTVNPISINIEGIERGTIPGPPINIGTNGTSIVVTLQVAQGDIDNAGGQQINIIVDLYNGTSNADPQIGTQLTDSTALPGTISVNTSVADSQITTQLFIQITLSSGPII